MTTPTLMGERPAGWGDAQWAAHERLVGRLEEALNAHRRGGVGFAMERLDDGSFDVRCDDPAAQEALRAEFAAAGDEYAAGGWAGPFRWAWREQR